MRRWHLDKKIALREWRKHRRKHVDQNKRSIVARVGIGMSPDVVECRCDDQVGRFRKIDAFDCGRPRCGLCHYDKYYARESANRRQAAADLSFWEQMNAQIQKGD